MSEGVLLIVVPASMVAVALLVWGTLAYGARNSGLDPASRRRFVLVAGMLILGWLGSVTALGGAGFFEASPDRTFPALLLALLLPIGAGAVVLRRSSVLRAVLEAVPVPILAGVQFYRVFGVVFLALYFAELLPAAFALPAGAGDLAVGLAAPAVAWLYHTRAQGSGGALLGWNLVGILDLAIAVAIGFLTAPGPLQAFALEAPNRLITAWPLVLVPAFAVPLSVFLHLAVLRRLKSAAMEVPGGRPVEGWVSRLMAI